MAKRGSEDLKKLSGLQSTLVGVLSHINLLSLNFVAAPSENGPSENIA
jgi:hypothetical protein